MKKIKKTLIAVAIIALNSTAVLAYSGGYSGYQLPKNQGNNYTGKHAKESNDQYIRNQVIKLSGTGEATFWAADENYSQISNDYKMKVGQTANIKLTTRKSISDEVTLGMENSNSTGIRAWVDGWVDLR